MAAVALGITTAAARTSKREERRCSEGGLGTHAPVRAGPGMLRWCSDVAGRLGQQRGHESAPTNFRGQVCA